MEHLGLSDAVEKHVRPGDAIGIFYGHSRWTALAREVCRQFWRRDPGFELQTIALGNMCALFFHGRLLRRCVTSYVGNSLPTGGPNPIFTRAVRSGDVEVEHWSNLTFQQRVEAAARGLPALVTASLSGTSMAGNAAFQQVDTTFGPVNLVAPLACDVALMHAPVADVHGNVAFSGPLMDGPWAGWAAQRGALVTVERVVDDLSPYRHLVHLPAHRVLAVVEAPFGAHPGGLHPVGLPVEGYDEDIPFWADAAAAAKGDFDRWAATWCLDVPTHDAYLALVGRDRLAGLAGADAAWDTGATAAAPARPPADDADITVQEKVGAVSARELLERARAVGADAILAGAGLSNLAAWSAVAQAAVAGTRIRLAADVGLFGYRPSPGDPRVFSHRAFASAEMLADCSRVLGVIAAGPGTRTIGALGGAEVDRHGNINSTDVPGTGFLAGSGGAADVAARADECVVSVVASRRRLVDRCAYVTSPGRTVRSVCTDKGILRKSDDGELRLAAVLAGDGPRQARIRDMVDSCGWNLQVDRNVGDVPKVSLAEVARLRAWDPQRLFLA